MKTLPVVLILAVVWTFVAVGCVTQERYIDQNVSVVIPKAITSTDILVNFNKTFQHEAGRDAGAPILVFGLSTCHWCQETRKTLNGYGIEYWWVDIDTLTPKMSSAMYSQAGMMGVCKDIPSEVPVIVKGTACIVGYNPDKLYVISTENPCAGVKCDVGAFCYMGECIVPSTYVAEEPSGGNGSQTERWSWDYVTTTGS